MARGIPIALFLLAAGCSGGIELSGDEDATDDAHRDTPISEDCSCDTSDIPPWDTGDVGDGPIEVPPSCGPMDAHAEGPCAAIVPGIAWNGEHCVPLGSGCSCAGTDCGAVYDTFEACVTARRTCYPDVACDPQPVADDTCVNCIDDTFLGAAWNGRECIELMGCACTGDGCATLFGSVEECAAYHAGCDGALCLATGGKFFPAGAGFCGFSCGYDNPRTCESPFDSCRCAPGMTFVPGTGCTSDDSCGPRELCLGSHGTWHPAAECHCGFVCGRDGLCDACLDSCDCGPHRNFGPGGCVADVLCEAPDRAEICTDTGGTWHECGPGGDCSCGDYYCGIPNLLDPCVMPGCDCGPYANFDSVEGCVWDDGCVLNERGAACSGYEASPSCRPGLACCYTCGIRSGCAACTDPCCGSGDPICTPGGCGAPPP
jgi:hypothetical protein